MPRRFQFSLRALLTKTAVICLGLAALSLALTRPDEFESDWSYIMALAGGLVVAGGSFGIVIGIFFRQPLTGAIFGAVIVPIIGYAALETGLLTQWTVVCP